MPRLRGFEIAARLKRAAPAMLGIVASAKAATTTLNQGGEDVTRRYLLVLGVLFLSACTTIYTPEEWPITEGNIPHFPVSGNVSITNGQASTEPTIVYSYAGTKLQSNYREITAMLANVARKALQPRRSD